MTREEAENRAARMNAEHPDRGAYRWIARAQDDSWQVARVTIPGGVRLDPLKEAVEARTRPEPSDPRSAFERNVGGPWVGGV